MTWAGIIARTRPSHARAHANSRPRMASPAGTTMNAGPGSTTMARPPSSTVKPITPMATFLAQR